MTVTVEMYSVVLHANGVSFLFSRENDVYFNLKMVFFESIYIV